MSKEAQKIGKEYFEANPVNVVEILDDIKAPTTVELKKSYNEITTDLPKSELIRRVFENKTKTLLDKKDFEKFNDGGGVENDIIASPNDEVWTPYEFLHELLPKIYGKDYVVTDVIGKKLYANIEKEEIALQADISIMLEEEGVKTIFELSVDKFNTIDNRRKGIEAKRVFITKSELEAFVLTNPDLNRDNYVKEIKSNQEDLIEDGLMCLEVVKLDGYVTTTKWVYRYQYLSGNIQSKISDMHENITEYEKELTEAQYTRQLEALNKTRNPLARITHENQNKIFIHPASDFAGDKANFIVKLNDWKFYEVVSEYSLKAAFIQWLRYSDEVDPTDYRVTGGSGEVISYYVEEQETSINEKQNTQEDGERLFQRFLNDALSEDCKQRLEAVWNAKYNNLVLPKMYKVPVALTLNKHFLDGAEFIPNPTQVQSVQFIRNSGSGLLAYGVGVGKTASSIMNVSYAIDNNMSKYPLFVVPLPTYEKWQGELQGKVVTTYTVIYTDGSEKKTRVFKDSKEAKKFNKKKDGEITSKTIRMQGLLPHLPKLVPLGNLGADIVRYELKDYSDDEMIHLEKIDEAREYLSALNPSYDFTDEKVNSHISSLFDAIEWDFFFKQYTAYSTRFVVDEYTGERLAPKAEKQKTMLRFFKEGFTPARKVDYQYTYIGFNKVAEELVYRLGTIKSFPEKTMFVTTYEGMSKLGVESLSSDKRDSINTNTSLFGTVYRELSQGNEIEDIRGWVSGTTDNIADNLEVAMFGDVLHPKVFAKDLGIDYIVFDESHSFKKLFTDSKGKPKEYSHTREDGRINRQKKRYTLGKGGNPSARALSAFANVRNVQFNNDNKNIVHLTATPFTNDPIEVYSMLALTNYQFLVNAGYRWIEDFYDAYMKISYDLRYTASQKIRKEQLLVGYNNAPQMRSLVYFLMDYKSGEDANIKRPEKFMLPNYDQNIETIVPPHPEQELAFRLIKDYIRGEKDIAEICDLIADDVDVENMTDGQLITLIITEGSQKQIDKWELMAIPLTDTNRIDAVKIVTTLSTKKSKDDLNEQMATQEEKAFVRILKGLSMMKQVTLSPYLFTCRKAGGLEPTYKQYVETSPKLMYVINCIKKNHEYERSIGKSDSAKELRDKLSGSVIYMNIGVSPSIMAETSEGFIKKKWKDGGFEKIKQYFVNELGYEEGQISIVKGGMSNKDKEKEKNKFLSGESIVLIGSSTISQGVDLQNNASSLFVCSFDWNPTDNEQVNGRIHRQGNRFAGIRISYPMIENSADPVIFQLLQEKTLRIKEIWDRDGRTSALDLRDFNPSDLKQKLITDPEDKLHYWLEDNLKKLRDERTMLENRQLSLRNASDDYEALTGYREPMKAMLTVIDAYKKNIKKQEGLEEYKTKQDAIMLEFGRDAEAMVKELEKLNKNLYDFQADPDKRFEAVDFSKLNDDELYTKIINTITNSDSWWTKNVEEGTVDVEELNLFTSDKFPDYYDGKWISDKDLEVLESNLEEIDSKHDEAIANYEQLFVKKRDLESELNYRTDDSKEFAELVDQVNEAKTKDDELRQELRSAERHIKLISGGVKVRFHRWSGINEDAYDWKNAKKLFDKHRERLEIYGIKANEIETAKQMLIDRLVGISEEMDTVASKEDEMYEVFQKEQLAQKAVAPSVLQRVEEYASMNAEFIGIDSQLETFSEDTAPVVEAVELKTIKPKVIKPTKSTKVDKIATDTDFLKDKIEAFNMMLEIEEDENEITFLKDKIEAFEMMLDLED